MKKLFICFSVVALTLVSIVLGSAVLFAGVDADEIPGKNDKSITDVLATLESKGFTYIASIEFDDHLWKVETLSNGEETKYRIDPKSLAITKTKTEKEDDFQPPKDVKSMKEALALAYGKGYKTIRAIEFDKGRWKISVADNDTERELIIDSDSKKILFDRVDD